MADPFGLSFSPGASNGPNGQPANGRRPTPIQQAIQTLSLRIPRTPGASAFTATPLLTSPGGMGLGGNPNSAAVLEQLRRMLFGGGGGADMNGTGVTGMTSAPPSSGPDLGAIFSQIFGQPGGMARDSSPMSGSGAPMGGDSGMGAPLPEGGAPGAGPIPRFDAGKDYHPLALTSFPDYGPPPANDRTDTQMI